MIVGVLLGATHCGVPDERVPIARNVLLVMVDTLRADRLGCYGYPRRTSPTIDALAAEGTLYRDNRPQGSITITSMISLMSGRYVTQREEVLPDYIPTLSETVGRAGIETVAIAGNQTLFGNRGFHRGFDHFEAIRGGRGDEVVGQFLKWLDVHNDPNLGATASPKKPFFGWLHIMDPHTPYLAEERFARPFLSNNPRESELLQIWHDEIENGTRLSGKGGDADIRDAIRLMLLDNNLYDAEVASADAAIQTLLDGLRTRGTLDDTLVIFASDHGEELYERLDYPEEIRRVFSTKFSRPFARHYFAYGHGWSFRESVWHTPLILRGPGVAKGRVVDEMTENLDIFPTVLEAFGLVIPPEISGQSLYGDVKRSFAFGFTNEMVAVKHGDEKFVDHRARLAKYSVGTDESWESELFDLEVDPNEQRNRSDDDERVARYRKLIDDWRQTHKRATDVTLTDDDMRSLRELGYVQEK